MSANINDEKKIIASYLYGTSTREQVVELECVQKILKMADFLHGEAVFAYNAYFILRKLSECEQSCEKGMGLSPYLNHMLRKTSTDSIVAILTKAYKYRKYRSKEYSIDLLMETCREYRDVLEIMSARSGFLLQIPVPKLWTTIDEMLAAYYKSLILNDANDCSSCSGSCATLKDSYSSILVFLDDIRILWKDLPYQVMDYCTSMQVHYDRDGNLNEKDPDWRSVEILIQYQLIFSGFIKNVLSAKENAVFEGAADFDKMFQAIRQAAYQSF